jgi:hypothetical protein
MRHEGSKNELKIVLTTDMLDSKRVSREFGVMTRMFSNYSDIL